MPLEDGVNRFPHDAGFSFPDDRNHRRSVFLESGPSEEEEDYPENSAEGFFEHGLIIITPARESYLTFSCDNRAAIPFP